MFLAISIIPYKSTQKEGSPIHFSDFYVSGYRAGAMSELKLEVKAFWEDFLHVISAGGIG